MSDSNGKVQCRECMKRLPYGETQRAAKLGGGDYRSASRRRFGQICGPCAAYFVFSHVGSHDGYCGSGRWEMRGLRRVVESLKPKETVEMMLDVVRAHFARGTYAKATLEPIVEGEPKRETGGVLRFGNRVLSVVDNHGTWMVSLFTQDGWPKADCLYSADEPNIPAVVARISREGTGWL